MADTSATVSKPGAFTCKWCNNSYAIQPPGTETIVCGDCAKSRWKANIRKACPRGRGCRTDMTATPTYSERGLDWMCVCCGYPYRHENWYNRVNYRCDCSASVQKLVDVEVLNGDGTVSVIKACTHCRMFEKKDDVPA